LHTASLSLVIFRFPARNGHEQRAHQVGAGVISESRAKVSGGLGLGPREDAGEKVITSGWQHPLRARCGYIGAKVCSCGLCCSATWRAFCQSGPGGHPYWGPSERVTVLLTSLRSPPCQLVYSSFGGFLPSPGFEQMRGLCRAAWTRKGTGGDQRELTDDYRPVHRKGNIGFIPTKFAGIRTTAAWRVTDL